MRNRLYFVLCAMLCLTAIGCSATTSGTNPYAGSYVGTYTNSVDGGGAIAITILANGQVTGREINTSADTTETLSGNVTTGGVATITDINGANVGSVSLARESATRIPNILSASLTSTNGSGTSATSNITATTTFGGTAGIYAGSYSGSYIANNTGTTTGTLTLIVGGNGAVTGLVNTFTNGTSFTTTGTMTSAGALSMTGGGQTISGKLTFSGLSVLGGPLTSTSGETFGESLTSP